MVGRVPYAHRSRLPSLGVKAGESARVDLLAQSPRAGAATTPYSQIGVMLRIALTVTNGTLFVEAAWHERMLADRRAFAPRRREPAAAYLEASEVIRGWQNRACAPSIASEIERPASGVQRDVELHLPRGVVRAVILRGDPALRGGIVPGAGSAVPSSRPRSPAAGTPTRSRHNANPISPACNDHCRVPGRPGRAGPAGARNPTGACGTGPDGAGAGGTNARGTNTRGAGASGVRASRAGAGADGTIAG